MGAGPQICLSHSSANQALTARVRPRIRPQPKETDQVRQTPRPTERRTKAPAGVVASPLSPTSKLQGIGDSFARGGGDSTQIGSAHEKTAQVSRPLCRYARSDPGPKCRAGVVSPARHANEGLAKPSRGYWRCTPARPLSMFTDLSLPRHQSVCVLVVTAPLGADGEAAPGAYQNRNPGGRRPLGVRRTRAEWSSPPRIYPREPPTKRGLQNPQERFYGPSRACRERCQVELSLMAGRTHARAGLP